MTIFTDRPKNEEPIPKPKKYPNTQLLQDLISIISSAKNFKNESDQAKDGLKKLEKRTDPISKEEFEEMREMEMELLEARRYHKKRVNEAEVRLYATKCMALSIYMIALAVFGSYKVYCSRNAEQPIESWIVMVLVEILILVIFLCLIITLPCFYSYNLVHDGTPIIRSQLKLEKMFKEKKNPEISEEMMKEQIRLIDIFSEEVLPLKYKADRLAWSRRFVKAFSTIPIYYFLWICIQTFFARHNDAIEGSMDNKYCIYTVIATVIITPFILNPM